MTSMNISLPEDLRAFVERKVGRGGYSSVSEYLRELIRVAREKEGARGRVNALLLESLGEAAEEMTSEEWQAIRDEVKKRARSRKPDGTSRARKGSKAASSRARSRRVRRVHR